MGMGHISPAVRHDGLLYSPYHSELELPTIAALIEKELSEPYIIYTYRYFLNQWPQLCWLARDAATNTPTGVIVCKLDRHLKGERKMRGYIAMLSVHPDWRGKGIASHLVKLAMAAMIPMGADEVVLETEVDNVASLALYERLGFIREKRMYSFYLNGKDCFRLVLSLPNKVKDLILASVELPAAAKPAETRPSLGGASHSLRFGDSIGGIL